MDSPRFNAFYRAEVQRYNVVLQPELLLHIR